eukprot:SAG25_NODE_1762_length_2378_cov_25.470731_5_plen_454_part_00
MSVYPRNLSAFLNRLTGYNKNNIKMNVLGSTTAKIGDTIQVDLPTNSIVDLSSLAWAFTVTYADPTTAEQAAVLPINCEALISRLAVEVNGQTLVNIQNYNALFHALLYMTATEDYQLQRRVAQSNGAYTKEGREFDGQAERLHAGGTITKDHVIDSWVGFLGSAKPNFIDTSLLGNVRITITLAGPEIINGTDNSIKRSYEISDQHFSMDVVSISDGIYDSMIDAMLASGQPIEVPFKNYFSFTAENAANMSNRLNFHVASQSIDRLWATARPSTYKDADNADEITGEYRPTYDADGAVTGQEPIPNSGHSIVQKDAPSFRFASCGGKNFQFQVNNTLYPNWTSDKLVDYWQHTKLAVGDQGNMLSGSFPQTIGHYMEHFFVYACQLEHRTDGDERFVSGIDTRGAAASCFFMSDPGGTGYEPGDVANQTLVFAECTSSLKIMANKVLEIVQ